jgi:hypothetical protein
MQKDSCDPGARRQVIENHPEPSCALGRDRPNQALCSYECSCREKWRTAFDRERGPHLSAFR